MHAILLTGVALVGLPILLHLIMKQEPKKVQLPTFRFLKQKQRINQRKLRLRHLLLMGMRMLLIALLCLALFQPTVISEGLNLSGDQPVAAVLIIDSSPSMGYVQSDRSGLTEARKKGLALLEETAQGPWTALDDARYRAMEILDELSPLSRVAILDTGERGEATWSLSIADARKRIQGIRRTRPNSVPLTRSLEQAYNLMARIDQQMENGEQPLPKLLFVFSDRTNPSWDSNRLDDLKKAQERVPPPSIHSTFIDVGVEKPVNMAIQNVEIKPQIISATEAAVLNVTVSSVGTVRENIVVCRIQGQIEPQKKPITIGTDGQASVSFLWDKLKPGLYQGEVRLEREDDFVPFDNIRYFTFRVREPRQTLVVVDDPQEEWSVVASALGMRGRAMRTGSYWRLALVSHRMYEADIATVSEVTRLNPEEWTKYEAVTLAALDRPTEELWNQLTDYVKSGGQLIVLPGERMNIPEYDTKIARDLLPGTYRELIATDPKGEGIGWAWDALNYSHPFLAPFKEWKESLQPIDLFKFQPRTYKYWDIDGPRQAVISWYADAAEADKRRPAILEKPIGNRGRVVQFTTSWDARRDIRGDMWNDYILSDSSFFIVVPNEMIRYLTGDSKDANFNYLNGQNVLVKWPPETGPSKPYYLSGPDVATNDQVLKREPGQAFLRLGPERLIASGNFKIESEADRKWSEGFSLNPAPEESNLERLPVAAIEELLGQDSVALASKELQLKEMLSGTFTQPIELFPFLMILLLLFLAVENLLANKFYQQPKRE